MFKIVIQYVIYNINVVTNFINYDSIQRNTLTFLKYGKEHKFVEWKCSQMCFTQLHIGSYFDCRMSNHVLLLAVHIDNHRTSTTEFWTNLHCFLYFPVYFLTNLFVYFLKNPIYSRRKHIIKIFNISYHATGLMN